MQDRRTSSWSPGPGTRLWGSGGWTLSCRRLLSMEMRLRPLQFLKVWLVVSVQLCVSDLEELMDGMSLTVETDKSLSSQEPEGQPSVGPSESQQGEKSDLSSGLRGPGLWVVQVWIMLCGPCLRSRRVPEVWGPSGLGGRVQSGSDSAAGVLADQPADQKR